MSVPGAAPMIADGLLLAVTVESILFDVAEALRVPVLVLALGAAVIVTLEVGALLVELRRRRRRGIPRLEQALDVARGALSKGDRDGAIRAMRGLGYSRTMADTLGAIVDQRGRPDAGERVAKRMAEYDYRSMKRLERTRILVRAGPALGLMGTLIPLSPALEALAEGDVGSLTNELRVAFSVTVAGLLIGMVAFAVSLVRDRLYSQDYSDVEYVAAALGGELPPSDGRGGAGAAQTAAPAQVQQAPAGTTPAPSPAATAVMPAATSAATDAQSTGAPDPKANPESK